MAQRTGIAISPRAANDEIRVNALLFASPSFRNVAEVAVAFEPELEVDGVGRELERRRAERDDAPCGSEPAVPPLFFAPALFERLPCLCPVLMKLCV